MSSKTFYWLYALLSVINLIVIAIDSGSFYRDLLLLLIVVVLFIYLNVEFRDVPRFRTNYLYISIGAMAIGLIFLREGRPGYNLQIGALFFLIANLSYTKLFYRCSDIRIKPLIPFILVVLVVVLSLFFFFYEYLDYYYGLGLVYLLIFLNCFQAAYMRNSIVSTASFRFVFYGMCFFFLAQVSAVFYQFAFAHSLIEVIGVGCYLISQVMIIRGLVLELQDDSRCEEIAGL